MATSSASSAEPSRTATCSRCGKLVYNRSAELSQLMRGPMACNRDQADAALPASCGCDVRAITVLQPWADRIAHGGKTIETRTWGTAWRGILFIHAGVSKKLLDPRTDLRRPWDLGRMVAVAVLADCRRLKSGDETAAQCMWAPGSWGFVLEDIQALPQTVHYRGRQRLWKLRIPGEIIEMRQWAWEQKHGRWEEPA